MQDKKEYSVENTYLKSCKKSKDVKLPQNKIWNTNKEN